MMKTLFSQTIQKALFLLVAILTLTQVAISQSEMPAHNPVAIKAIDQDMFTHVPVPDGFVAGAERSVVINVDYNGFTASAQTAFQYAVDIWASQLTSSVPIEIEATWEDIPGNTLGYAGASSFYINFSGAPESDTYYPLALANKHYGSDLSPGNPDIEASFDSGTNWYLGTDGNPPSGQYDFVSVVLHELGHGLGVQGSADVSGSTGYIGLGVDPIIFDHFVENGSGTAITSYTSGTTTLGNQLTGNNLFFNGSATMAANGGNEAKMYAPSSWESGSSYSHLDENTFPAGTPNSLMTPFIGSAESIHSPGAVVLGLMADIGWEVEVSGGCTADGMTFTQEDCADNGGGVLPVIGMTFSVTGGCMVEDLCFSVDGGAVTCLSLPDNGIVIGDGEGINLVNTTADGVYEFYFTLDDGTVSSTFIWQNGNCDGTVSGCTNPFADNYDSTAEAEDGSCIYSDTICDCSGTEHTIGVLIWVGDGFADNDAYEWDLQLVNFDCSTWGYDCGDIDGSPSDDPYGVCNGNLPPNNGCDAGGDCSADWMNFEQLDCEDNGDGLLPVFGMTFEITGTCLVQDLCFTVDGGAETCFDMIDLGYSLGDGDGINLINTTPDGTYQFYYTLDDGTSSGTFLWGNGNCDVGGCTADLMTFTQEECEDNGDGLLPTIGMLFNLTGDCIVEDVCFSEDGGAFTCLSLTDAGFFLGDGEGINLINTVPDAFYEFYFTLDDGAQSGIFTWQNGNCEVGGCTADLMTFTQEECEDNGDGLLPTIGMLFNLTGDCIVEDVCFAADGGEFTCLSLTEAGFFLGDGEGINLINTIPDAFYEFYFTLDDGAQSGIFTWQNGNCDPGGCTPNNMTFEQLDCEDNGDGILPVFGMTFDITGDCLVQDLCFTVDGGEEVCFDMIDLGFLLGDGEGINLINTTPNGVYEFYYTLDDGSQSGFFTWQNGNCGNEGCTADLMTFTQEDCQDNGDGLLPVIGITFGITGDCLVQEICNSVDGGAFTCTDLQDAGFFLGDGDGINLINGVPDAFYEFYFILDDGSISGTYTWQNGNCDGTGCTADSMVFEQLDCQDDGEGNILPVFGMTFGITGDCLVQDLCFTVDGGEETCFDMIDLGFILGNGDAINLINTTPNGLYELYFTLDDGTVSSTFIWQNGNCDDAITGCTNPYADNYNSTATTDDGSCVYSDTLCDCSGTEHTIGVYVWVGDGFADDGAYTWDGQPVDFNCSDWGYDCGDIEGAPTDDPYGVCNGNLPPDNGCIDDCSDIEVTLSFDFDCWAIETGWQLLDDMNNVLFEVAAGDYEGLAAANEMMCLPAGCYSVIITDEFGDGMFGSQYTECEIDGYYIMMDEYGNILFEMGIDPDYGFSITHDFCLEEEDVFGCMDSMACNYDNDATIDDGSCEYQSCLGCTDFEACNYDFTASIDDGSCDYSCYGCTDLFACNYDVTATINDGSCEYDCYGCTDSLACNFNPLSTINDGSCEYDCYGCIDFLACNFDDEAIFDDGSCDYSCYGCTDIEACNYDFFAEFEDGSCDYSCYGCTDSTATNYDPDATIDDGSCQFGVIEGCMDSEACNYDEFATVDDGSCDYNSCLGCTDFFSCNYDSTATIDDGTCDYTCYGCTDSTATNFDPNATIDDGSCVWGDIFGCMDSEACNYNEFATIDDGSCEYQSCLGCTDPLAENYDPTATIDDGSCIYDCEYPVISYDVFCDSTVTGGFFIEMTIDDLGNGSPYEITNNINADMFTLSFTGNIELGPFDNDEVVVLTVESTIIPNCFLTSPPLTHDCFVNIEEQDDFNFTVYPNPNTGEFVILSENYSGKASLDVYDMTGKLVYAQELRLDNGNEQRINLGSDISSGNYFVSIMNGNKISHIKLLIEK